MSRKYFYVSPSSTNWKLTYESKVLYEHANKQNVVAVGRETAKKFAPSELVIKNADGTIAERETYGSDPYPPRG